jgi:hypothetical protein
MASTTPRWYHSSITAVIAGATIVLLVAGNLVAAAGNTRLGGALLWAALGCTVAVIGYLAAAGTAQALSTRRHRDAP